MSLPVFLPEVFKFLKEKRGVIFPKEYWFIELQDHSDGIYWWEIQTRICFWQAYYEDILNEIVSTKIPSPIDEPNEYEILEEGIEKKIMWDGGYDIFLAWYVFAT